MIVNPGGIVCGVAVDGVTAVAFHGKVIGFQANAMNHVYVELGEWTLSGEPETFKVDPTSEDAKLINKLGRNLLAGWGSDRSKPLLIDVRTVKRYQVLEDGPEPDPLPDVPTETNGVDVVTPRKPRLLLPS